ncbi:MAG: 3-oxoacyl-ACP reductase FabG [Legionellaceae bacterium]|nr:3-oxoacyl-ACP reductase FabG [Legionellaceae bacterium]
MNSLKDRIALVTGASRGIGMAIAKTLAENGAYVIGTATTEKGAQNISTYLEAANLPGEGAVLNVTDSNSIDTLLSTLDDADKTPHILVNNAGVTADNLLLRMSDEEWDRVIATNLSAIFRMTRAAIKPMFRARFGRIINVGSVVGSSGNSGQTNYTAAKAGLIGFSKSLAQEIGSRGITVNVVAPGFIETEMTEVLPDMVKSEMKKRIPLKRFGAPEDIAAAVAFLASDAAKYITGETIHVNGGMYMH